MTAFYLIRHGSVDALGHSLAGRSGIRLSERGREEARRLGERLRPVGLAAVYASPMPRTRETAAEVARVAGLAVYDSEPFSEIEFGAWSGRSFDDLEQDERWRRFNTFRSGTRPPDGELMLEVQARAVAELLRLKELHSGDRIAVVSHADVLRGVLAWFTAIPLDLALRLEVSPASVSLLVLYEDAARVVCVNHTEVLPEP